jgi:hypothetical protein
MYSDAYISDVNRRPRVDTPGLASGSWVMVTVTSRRAAKGGGSGTPPQRSVRVRLSAERVWEVLAQVAPSPRQAGATVTPGHGR